MAQKIEEFEQFLLKSTSFLTKSIGAKKIKRENIRLDLVTGRRNAGAGNKDFPSESDWRNSNFKKLTEVVFHSDGSGGFWNLRLKFDDGT
jgi:hypothetical protein